MHPDPLIAPEIPLPRWAEPLRAALRQRAADEEAARAAAAAERAATRRALAEGLFRAWFAVCRIPWDPARPLVPLDPRADPALVPYGVEVDGVQCTLRAVGTLSDPAEPSGYTLHVHMPDVTDFHSRPIRWQAECCSCHGWLLGPREQLAEELERWQALRAAAEAGA